MLILGIETSCDETAAAVVEDGTKILSNVIASQIPLHHKTGGVVPEVAAREHVLKIVPVIDEALRVAGAAFAGGKGFGDKAGLSLRDIDAIAVTQGPGLLSSLIIGVSAASCLAITCGKPLIPVNHVAGHIYANWLNKNSDDTIEFPILVLTVSGGHNELVLMKSHTNFKLLGETLDDAAGEAFDKVARLLGLGYPGGPHISRVANSGNAKRFAFPRAYMGKTSYDFSFSGLKTAVLNTVKKEYENNGILSEEFIFDCAASFQETVCNVLTDKLLRAANQFNVTEVHLAGGVSANSRLREIALDKILKKFFYDHNGKKVKLTVSPKLRFAKDISLCTDNAAMIASAAFFHYIKAPEAYAKNPNALADPSLSLY